MSYPAQRSLRPLHIEILELNLKIALRILGRPSNQSANSQVPILASTIIISKDPANLTQRYLGTVLLHVVHPEARAHEVALLLDEHSDALGVLKGGERRDAPVGPTVAGDGAELWRALVILEAGLDPSLLAARVGVESDDETCLVVLFGPVCGKCDFGGLKLA